MLVSVYNVNKVNLIDNIFGIRVCVLVSPVMLNKRETDVARQSLLEWIGHTKAEM